MLDTDKSLRDMSNCEGRSSEACQLGYKRQDHKQGIAPAVEPRRDVDVAKG